MLFVDESIRKVFVEVQLKDWHTISLEINPDPQQRVKKLDDCLTVEDDYCNIEAITSFFGHACSGEPQVLGGFVNLNNIQGQIKQICQMRVPWYKAVFNTDENTTMSKTLGNIFKETYHENIRLAILMTKPSILELINSNTNFSHPYSMINDMTTPEFLEKFMQTSLEGVSYITYASVNNSKFQRVKNSIATLKSKKVHEWPQVYSKLNMTSSGLWLLAPNNVFGTLMGNVDNIDASVDFLIRLYVLSADAYRRRTLRDIMNSYNIDMPYLKQKTVNWLSAELLGFRHFDLAAMQSATAEENEAFKQITFADVVYFQKGASIETKSVVEIEGEMKPIAGTARFMSAPLESLASDSSLDLNTSTVLQFAESLSYVNSSKFLRYVSDYDVIIPVADKDLLQNNLQTRNVRSLHRLFKDFDDTKDPRKMSLTEIIPVLTKG